MALRTGWPSRWWFPLLLLTPLVVLPYWELAAMQGVMITDDVFASDVMNSAFPYRYYLGQALKAGELPLWFTPAYGGYPLLARGEAGAAYPPNLLLFGLLPPYPALNLTILFTLLTSGVGMFVYLRRLGCDAGGGLLGALAFAHSGFMVAHLKHLGMVNSASWLPIGLYLIERGIAGGSAGFAARVRAYLPLAVVFAVQCLAGHFQATYIAGLAYLAYFAFRIATCAAPGGDHPPQRGQHAVAFVLALALGCGLAGVQIVSTWEMVALSARAGGVGFDYAAAYAYDPRDALTFLFPYATHDAGDGRYLGSGIFWEDYGYVGLPTLLLAFYTVVRFRRHPHVRFFAAAGGVAYLLVLGPNTPVYEAAFRFVPGMSFFRFPTRFLLVVDASLAILAGYGLSRLFSRQTGSGDRAGLLASAVVALVALDLIYHQPRHNPVAALDAWRSEPATARLLKQDPERLFRIHSPGASEKHEAAFAEAGGWQADLRPFLEQREFLQPNLNVLFGLSSADGYTQLTPREVVDVWGDQHRPGLVHRITAVEGGELVSRAEFVKVLSIFNVKYLLSAWPFRGPALQALGRHGDVHLYRNPLVLPRAYLVGSYRIVPSAAEALEWLRDPSFDPSREALVARDPAIPVAPGSRTPGTCRVERYASNEVVVRVEAERPALLVLADTFYPGWRAAVDGREVEVLRANVCQRAVAVPAGEHVVRFHFDSPTVAAGAWVSFISLLLVAAAWRLGRPRGGRSSSR